MALNFLLDQVRNAITNHAGQQQQQGGGGYDPSALLGQVEGLFGQHAESTGQSILPASQDQYGDAGNQQNILPASQDPYGDPGQNILPASQDPYGDPGARR